MLAGGVVLIWFLVLADSDSSGAEGLGNSGNEILSSTSETENSGGVTLTDPGAEGDTLWAPRAGANGILGCCSWNLRDCQKTNTHCVTEDTCSDCLMYWMPYTENRPQCASRKSGCSADEDCCSMMTCQRLEDAVLSSGALATYNGCDIPHCCTSQDFPDECMERDYCNHNADNCKECNSTNTWVQDKSTLTNNAAKCQHRFQSCIVDEDCCTRTAEDLEETTLMTCQEFLGAEGTIYKGCDWKPPEDCCSWNLLDCVPSTEYCGLNKYTCEFCNMYWIDKADEAHYQNCVPRLSGGCQTDTDCCGINSDTTDQDEMVCIQLERQKIQENSTEILQYRGCEVPFCCSSNLKDCSDRDFCNYTPENCKECGEGFWIERKLHEPPCMERFMPCITTADCCGNGSTMTCQKNTTNGNQRICDLSPSMLAGAEEEPDTATGTTSGSGSGTTPVVEDGPIVSAAESSERINIPQPPEPTTQDLLQGDARTNCPHLDDDLFNWHEGATWDGGFRPRADGDNATLPAGRRVVIMRPVQEKLGIITIPPTSELVLAERGGAGLLLDAQGIDVQGTLTAGSESCRIETKITITLHGQRPAILDPNDMTHKGIAVSGTLNLHGKRYFRTWTRLAQTIHPGDRDLLLQHAVNWELGQEIVLVTTALKDSRNWQQNEVLIVQTVETDAAALPDGVAAKVRVRVPVEFKHIVNRGYQAEVGLLSRTIVIQGAEDDSEPSDPDPGSCTSILAASYWGDTSVPCPDKELTGFGGHVIIHGNGRGHVQGIQLYRMGQTNVLARYPMHFNLLGECPECYFRDSSIYRSFYRCVSIHGTHQSHVTENVAYDVVGHCFYLEDGIEQENEIKFNLAAHVHFIGEPPGGVSSHYLPTVNESKDLLLPADVSAAGFWITNLHNTIVGNAASGGWTGFAFPNLPTPLQGFRDESLRPASVTSLLIDGNTAHSTGWWWEHSGGFYFGGTLQYDMDGSLQYSPGRAVRPRQENRRPCLINPCDTGDCTVCPPGQTAWNRITNTKAFLIPGTAISSWSGELEVVGFETYDVGLSVDAISRGFWLNNMLAVCRSGEIIDMPDGVARAVMDGTGFFWMDTEQDHILTDVTFRNCGYRSDDYKHYNSNPDRGCDSDASTGCLPISAVFRFITSADEFSPEIMQATKNIKYENCGRRFSLDNTWGVETVGGRSQTLIDTDGTFSQLGEPVLVGSGLEGALDWWVIEHDVVRDPEGPLVFNKKNNGPERGLGHLELLWDDDEHDQVGGSYCGKNGISNCPPLGHIRHVGHMFSPVHGIKGPGLPITANAEVVGLTGGFGWVLKLTQGAPRTLRIRLVEADPSSPLLLSIAYPPNTNFVIQAFASADCVVQTGQYSCMEEFSRVGSIREVRTGLGNTYHVDENGVLTIRIIQTPVDFVGRPDWFLPQDDDVGRDGQSMALPRFERDGVRLPGFAYGPRVVIEADCVAGGDGTYCADIPTDYDPDVCPFPGYQQMSYDRCCKGPRCIYADVSA